MSSARVTDPEELSFRITDMVSPDATNHYGTLFAGNLTALMARAGFMMATRFSKQSVVMAGSDQIDCFIPIRGGSLLDIAARIIYTGTTSMSVKIEIFAEDPVGRNRQKAAQGYFNMVAVDEQGHPAPVKAFVPSTAEEKMEWRTAESFRSFRSQMRGLEDALQERRKTVEGDAIPPHLTHR